MFGQRAPSRARRASTEDPGARGVLPDPLRWGLPQGFEAVAEALAPGSDTAGGRVVAACQVAGRDRALDGASLEECLDDLRTTWQAVRRCDPAYDAVQALLVAWSDTTLSYLHQLSCEDPMTGLASLAHVRSRVSELYRAAPLDGLGDSHVLVVCELVSPAPDREGRGAPDDRASTSMGASFTRAMHMASLGDAARTVFSGPETIGRVGTCRVVVVTRRDDRLGSRVRLMRTLTESRDLGDQRVRLWIEGLPPTEAGATTLLDELARP